MLQYILETLAFQLVFLLVYDLFLKKETFFQWNRAYLLLTFLLSLVLPKVHFEALKTTVSVDAIYYPEFLVSNQIIELTSSGKAPTFWELLGPFEWIFLLGALIMSIWFFVKLYRIQRLRWEGRVSYFPKFIKITVPKSNLAFSFFRQVFLGDAIPTEKEPQILAHEMVHIKQWHSLDLIFFELMRIGLWFNPMVYVYQSRMAELHEFIADAKIAKNGKKEQYQLLLSEAFQTQNLSFVNQFFRKSLIKKRIVMLTKKRSKAIYQFKYTLLVPLVLGMLVYSSCERESGTVLQEQSTENIINDAELISKIQAEIAALKGKIFTEEHSYLTQAILSEDIALSKEEFFKQRLYLIEMVKQVVNNSDFTGNAPDVLDKIPYPSTGIYNMYLDRTKAFQTLDKNLKVSIKAYKENVRSLENKNFYPPDYFVLQVSSVRKLETNEIITFNNKMKEIFETGSAHKNIVIKDDELAFLVFRKPDTSTKNLGQPAVFTLNLEVGDVNNQTPEEVDEYNKLLEQLYELEGKNYLILKDSESEIKISVENGDVVDIQVAKKKQLDGLVSFMTVDEVPIFPGCESVFDKKSCFQEKIQEHISRHFIYPKAAQELSIQGRVNVMFTINQDGDIENIRKRGPHKLLENEVERIIKRLPKMKPGIHKGQLVKVPFSIPVTFKLSDDINGFGLITSDAFDNQSGDVQKTVARYNQLVTERSRLLRHANEENPVIEKLDKQLTLMKAELQKKLNVLSS